MQSVDFVEANLETVKFENCDLLDAVFENTNLEKTNFITAHNYTLDPENNKINGAQFSKEEVIGLLNKYPITIK